MNPQTMLHDGAAAFGLKLDAATSAKFDTYSNFLLEYNEKVNLTAITDPAEVAVKHFVDSVAVAGLFELPQKASLVDVGTGAGFPGVPLKLVRPDLRLTLLDSLAKRLTFLGQLTDRLEMDATLVHARAEQAGADPALRTRFDVATSRAVGQLAVLCEYCLPLLRVGGVLLALKGPDVGGELKNAARALAVLGGKAETPISYVLPNGSGRSLVVVRKVAPTPGKYPRQRVNLSEKPIG